MHADEILSAVDAGEAKDWEFKSARGGLPQSLWATYSAMANTDGGVIVLGVDQREGAFYITGLDNPEKVQANFWSSINNRNTVNLNLISDDDVSVDLVDGRQVLVVRVPRASRRQRPVFTGQNPLTGTYRRNFEGDYHCTTEEVGRMLADQAEEPADSRILEGFGLDDLDTTSIQQYRQRFDARAPAHPWLGLELRELLEKLGGWRRERRTRREGLTAAGLLMFGKDEAIRSPEAFPRFHLDYRERLSDDPNERWSDRLYPDGTWPANLFQFYQRVIVRLTRDLKVPFRLEADLFRRDETLVHAALREALVNSLIHADYSGVGGVVIDKYPTRIKLSNAGTLLVSWEQLAAGGVSECRNKSLQTMFQMIGGGEKAGSGIDVIRRGWASQHWQYPLLEEQTQPERVTLRLPMVSLLPEGVLDDLRQRFGGAVDMLAPLDRQTLAIARAEGCVSNNRLQVLAPLHPAELTQVLQRLVARGYLVKDGHGRGTSYRLPQIPSSALAADSTPKAADSTPKAVESTPKAADSTPSFGPASPEWEALIHIAEPARRSQRLAPQETRNIISQLTLGRYLTAAQLGELTRRDPAKLREKVLTPMVQDGLLVRRYPDDPNHPEQAYMMATRANDEPSRLPGMDQI